MNEIEVRILDIDVEDIREKLLKYNAVLIKKENQINKLFDFTDGRLLEEKGYARIRIIADNLRNKHSFFMATKKIICNDLYKVTDEKEIEIDDPITAEAIFNSLGLVLKNSIKRYRESYELNGVLVEIDINDKNFCPFPYIEIEGNSKEKITEVVHMLGYVMEDTTSKTIFDIIKEYEEKTIE